MMTPANLHKEYSQNEISTANQGRLIVLMYEGAIKNTKMAIQCLENKDTAGQARHIRKTRDIINELSISLDMKVGQKTATRLESLYQFVLTQLTRANIKPDRPALESILRVLTPLHEAWAEVCDPASTPQKETTTQG
jgi:flagellar protein FliS